MIRKQNRKEYIKNRFIKIICGIFFIGFSFSSIMAQDSIPPLLKRPGEDDGTKKKITAEVYAIKAGEKNTKNTDEEGQDKSEVLEGDEALSFIIKKLGINDYNVVFKDKQPISTDNKNELHYKIGQGLDYYVLPQEVASSEVYTLDTRVQVTEGNKKVDAIKAIAKAKLGEPLVYKGIQLDNSDYIIIFTLKNEDENQSKGGEQNQEQQQKEQEQKENQQNNQDKDEQKKQEEQNNKEENKKENHQMELLLESLDDMDQKEQKEMLNERERIMLPEKWW
ncbi:MAG TPA: hypothetical protein PLA12_10010 [Candidatus Hydrogenedens sp.]|nr:hypothetical protein [Candidatus Hydrogenedens sp.]